jgi:hypothetical protein
MPELVAQRNDQAIGRIVIPDNVPFTWFLVLTLSARSSITVPVRMANQDKGWTRFFFADLSALPKAQVDALIANGVLKLERPRMLAAA